MFSFCKMQATGNDFVVVNCIENEFEYSLPVIGKFLCDRHYGVGADGVILIYKSEVADFKMKIINSDGTEAEMCGNGIRCLAKYVFEKGLIDKTEFDVETLAGIKKVFLQIEGNTVLNIKVNMGEIIPENLRYIIEIDEKQYQIYPVSLGNPHAVCFVQNVNTVDVKKIGKIIENYKYFPDKTNVEFVEVLDKSNIKVRVWERGVGETNSCGTGACASAIATISRKNMDDKISVKLKGGDLEVKYDKESKLVELSGSAEMVFEGAIEMM